MDQKITVYTKVYNTESYLRQCIESVLSQSYPNFEYILVDNGCTDSCGDIISEYAVRDKRIRLIRFAQNRRINIRDFITAHATGEYLAVLDSDDWWEPDYLERLSSFMEQEQLDIACTGTLMHIMVTGEQSTRALDQVLILPRESFAEAFPYYHVFFRTIWGKLIRIKCLQTVPEGVVPPLLYGADTLWCFQLLRCSNRIGIDYSVLHHYRVHKSSVSYLYSPQRFEADVYLYGDAVDFLSKFGPVSKQNRNFLQCVYSNAVDDTVNVIQKSNLPPMEKLREYRVIASHPITLTAYRECKDESASRSKTGMILKGLEAGAALGGQDDMDLRATMQLLLPHCGQIVSKLNAQMILENPLLLRALVQDDADAMMETLLEQMENGREVKRYNIAGMICALAVEKPLLCQINNAVFLRKYAGIYRKVWTGDFLTALDEMTGLLLENKVSSARETFLTLYISLSAVTEQAPAFIFGKMQLAELYLRQGRREQVHVIVSDLTDMGVEDADLEILRRESRER